MSDRHKVFVSYHHAEDQAYKERFVAMMAGRVVDWSVRDGDIPDGLTTETTRQRIRDEWLRDATVTVVLVGALSWQRKHIDWEIGSSLRDTVNNPRSGLVGILLPSYPRASAGRYDPSTLPPRLADNLVGTNPFAKLYDWTVDAAVVQGFIHAAFVRRNQEPPPNNARASFANNRSGPRWSN